MRTFFKKLSVPLVVAIVSIFGTLLVQQFLLTKQKPTLKKEIVRTDLSGLSSDVKKQIALVPITYTLQNNSRSVAMNVSVFIKSDLPLMVQDLKFSQESEDHQIGMPDPHEIKINTPSIRPDGLLSFQILLPANNNINFSELSDNADIVTFGSDVKQQGAGNKVFGRILFIFGILIWLPILGTLIYLFWQTGKIWRDIDTSDAPPDIRKKLIIMIVGLYIYNDLILGSTSVFGGFIPLPRISFEELSSAFILYLLITRYKLLEEWIKTMIERNKKQ